eukprot:GHVT01011189.1.p2 GENE.GHVT01011189.1~~GHVT01011189.1.p2  ORF type:complete len:270 (-),score=15.52 GHVT01011189.1:4453-5262(-)
MSASLCELAPANVLLRDTMLDILTHGIPIPNRAHCVEAPEEQDDTSVFVFRRFIHDMDGVVYKIQATGSRPTSVHTDKRRKTCARRGTGCATLCLVCCTCATAPKELGEYSQSCLDTPFDPIVRVRPTEFYLCVKLPFFEEAWLKGSADLVQEELVSNLVNSNGPVLGVAVLDSDDYNMEVTLLQIPDTAQLLREVVEKLARLRDILQCGPLLKYFLTISGGCLLHYHVTIRADEDIWLLEENEFLNVVISINSSVVAAESVARRICQV